MGHLSEGNPLNQDNSRVRQFENGTLRITGTTKEDGGRYKCKASNGIGSPLEDEIVLTVKRTITTFSLRYIVLKNEMNYSKRINV